MLSPMSDGYEPVRRALALVESRLTEPISLGEMAREACLSPWHFHRMFVGAVGEPPIGYLRRRRLSEAAKRLKSTESNVLEIALTYGFESQAAFSRAFRSQYGVPPSRFRREVALTPSLYYGPMNPANLSPKGTIMEPKIVEKPGFTVVGLSLRVTPTPENMKKIPLLWDQFGPRIASIPGRKNWECFGLCMPEERTKDDQPCFTYLCAMEVEPGHPVPDGMQSLEVPAARYAVFAFEDHISRIGPFIDKVFGEWMPASGLPRVSSPEFEHYDQRWDPKTGTGVVDYYVPIALL